MSKNFKFTDIPVKIEGGFWPQTYQKKLEELKLGCHKLNIYAQHEPYTNELRITNNAFDEIQNGKSINCKIMKGELIIVDTIKQFTEIVSQQNESYMETLWEDIKSGKVFNDNTLLNRFIISLYIDFKKYHFYHWVSLPVFKFPYNIEMQTTHDYHEIEQSKEKRDLIRDQINAIWEYNDPNISVFHLNDYIVEPLTLEHITDTDSNELVIIINDMGQNIFNAEGNCVSYPNRTLRNLLFALAYHMPDEGKLISIICYRETETGSIGDSLVIETHMRPINRDEINLNESKIPSYYKGIISFGTKGKPGVIDMSRSLSPEKLSQAALVLNTKLMKWRVSPELDLDMIANTKCLLIGSGTLGSNVARNLLGWGITHITFVDYGNVSYSNPARQSLFFQEDVGKSKAETAAHNFQKIYSNVTVSGVNLSVPMPGYPINDMEQLRLSMESLDQLIRDHDVVFLLTDTRESRWFPTLLCKSYNKMCFTAAIGFDTFVAMRHNSRVFDKKKLGCYFCTDQIAPSNTEINATLDKKCTVSRPGISGMVSGLVVELMISTIVRERQENVSKNLTELDDIPQQIRGDMSVFETKIFECNQSDLCIACCDTIQNFFQTSPIEFMGNVIVDPEYLRQLVNLTADNELDIIDVEYPEIELENNLIENNLIENNLT